MAIEQRTNSWLLHVFCCAITRSIVTSSSLFSLAHCGIVCVVCSLLLLNRFILCSYLDDSQYLQTHKLRTDVRMHVLWHIFSGSLHVSSILNACLNSLFMETVSNWKQKLNRIVWFSHNIGDIDATTINNSIFSFGLVDVSIHLRSNIWERISLRCCHSERVINERKLKSPRHD